MKRGLCLLLSILLAVGMLPSAAWAEGKSAVRIIGLETCGLVNPLGIDAETPVFDWRMDSERIGASQSAYRIVVKDDTDYIFWDSGTVESGLSTEIVYAGEALRPQTAYSWQVAVTDEQGNTWTSEEASFETGLLTTSLDAWDGAVWIGADAYPLDAASACVFDLSMTMQLSEAAPRAGIVLGGGDFRLANKAYNIWGSETEDSHFTIEIDATELSAPRLNLYAVGMPAVSQEAENAAAIAEVEAYNREIEKQIAEAEGRSASPYADGAYEGSAEGFGGAIRVKVTISDGDIADIEVLEAAGEDPAYYSQAESVLGEILSTQGVNVDTVTGATFSSTGLINAVTAALRSALKE